LKITGRAITICVAACMSAAAQPSALFTLVPAVKSGIRFTNEVKEDESLHFFKYEYLYNGDGIGVSDFNQDGLEVVFIFKGIFF